jgi:hypothetical protein
VLTSWIQTNESEIEICYSETIEDIHIKYNKTSDSESGLNINLSVMESECGEKDTKCKENLIASNKRKREKEKK